MLETQSNDFGRRITLGELLHESATKFGERPFISQAETGETLSYIEFEQRTNSLAHGIRAQLQTRNRSADFNNQTYVAIMLETTINYLALSYALKKLDLTEVSINRAFRGPSLQRMIDLTKAAILITSASHFDAISAIANQLPHLEQLVVTDDIESARVRFPQWQVIPFASVLSEHSHHIESKQQDTDVSTIMFTSGTTGVSKGCVLSHRFAVRTAENMIKPFRLTQNDVAYTPYPLSHIGPTYYDILPMMLLGARAVIRDGFSVSSFWPDAVRYGVTWFMCLGSVQQLLYAAPERKEEKQHKVTRCWATPAPVPKADFEARFGLHQMPGGGYGSTDAGWVVVPQWDHAGGIVLPHFEISIVDEHDDPVPAGHAGELLVRPLEPGVMSEGYFGAPDKTLESRRNLWFYTGDIGSVDEEGLFYFHCRKSERIRVMGEMINAFEIEESVLLHASVEDAAAIGMPADYGEEQIHLFITLKKGQTLTQEELLQHCKQHLAKFMVPEQVTILDSMPRTTTGKPEKGKLRADALEQQKAN